MDKMLDALEGMKASWMTGGTTEKTRPSDWQGVDELAVLALSGQFMRIATSRPAPGSLDIRPDLPHLNAPLLAEDLRPLFRRCLDNKMAEPAEVLHLIAARGYVVSPLDWMPKNNAADIPSLYDPWRDWLDGSGGPNHDDLNVDNWEAFSPHERYRAVTALHLHDPTAARTLIQTIAPTLAADQRLRLLEALRVHLSDADSELLYGFAKDRSSKVQAFVTLQLARLGHHGTADDTSELIAEAAEYFALERAGILSRRKVLSARKLKNEAQRRQRSKVLGQVTLPGLAEALDLTPDAFIDLLDIGGAVTPEVAQMVARSGRDSDVDRLAERMVDGGETLPDVLLDRLEPTRLRALGQRVLAEDDWSFAKSRMFFPHPQGDVPLTALSAAKSLPELMKLAANPETNVQDQQVAAALSFLGLISDRDAATALLDRLTGAGVMSVDPRLTLLRLNAAL